MNSEDLHARLTTSERKRSQAIVELTHTQMELEAAKRQLAKLTGGSPGGGSQSGVSPNRHRSTTGVAGMGSPGPSSTLDNQEDEDAEILREQLRNSERQRAMLAREITHLHTKYGDSSAPPGSVTVAAVDEPSDKDFMFTEEEEARAAAEEIMAQLLFSRRSLQAAKEEIMQVRLDLTEQLSKNDAARAREIKLCQMVDAYQTELTRVLEQQQKMTSDSRGSVSGEFSPFVAGHSSSLTTSGPLSPRSLRPELEKTRRLERENFELKRRLEEKEEEIASNQVQFQKLLKEFSSVDNSNNLSSMARAPTSNAHRSAVSDESTAVAYSQLLDHSKAQDELIRKLRVALKDSYRRNKELETLLAAASQ